MFFKLISFSAMNFTKFAVTTMDYWQSVVTLGSLLWLLNTTLNLMMLFVLVLHVRTVFGFIFLN